MSRALIILRDKASRGKAADWCARLPEGSRVEFKKPRRSNDQNALLWALLTDLAEQLDWHGQHLSPEDWKDYMMHSFRRARWVPDEDGGMVPIGMRTSDLSKGEMSDLVELIYAFGSRHGVTFAEPREAA